MSNWVLDIAITIAAFLMMEGIAWLSHKYIMHGVCWFLHKDHHRKEYSGFWERNDFFFLIFAIPGIVCLLIGATNNNPEILCVGVGITLYGACYFLVHDLFIHQRLKVLKNSEHWYLRAIRRAHKMHHKHLDKEHGECFGMLWVPLKYFRETRNQ